MPGFLSLLRVNLSGFILPKVKNLIGLASYRMSVITYAT